MSKHHERSEKVCLNCGAQLYARYCHICGQENVEPKESTWHLIVHFFNDVTHFDGKFFSTLRLLLIKPGRLTSEYAKGKRQQYLNPIRMYLFVSALFFIVISMFASTLRQSFSETRKSVNRIDDRINGTTTVDTISKRSQRMKDSAIVSSVDKLYAGLATAFEESPVDEDIVTVKQYDSLQKALPKNERDGWFNRYVTRRYISARLQMIENPRTFVNTWIKNFWQAIPKALFIVLPLFALFLYLLYILKRKQFYYVSHIIFSIHIFCTTFILILLGLAFTKASTLGNWLAPVFWFILPMVYLYLAMLRFYKQGAFVTLLKFLVLNILSLISVLVLVFIFFFNSMLNTSLY